MEAEPAVEAEPEMEAETAVGAEPAVLGPGQLQACLALDRRSLGGLWSASQWQVELADPSRPVIGLLRGDQLGALASGWLILDELHITAVAVDPRLRRLGLGRRVLEGLLQEGRQRGADRATLEVASGNGAARGLYRAVGFREAGIRRGYYRNGDDALIEWLDLKGWRPPSGQGSESPSEEFG